MKLSKTNTSGTTGVLQRPDCSIRDWMAYKHVNGKKLSMHFGTLAQARTARMTMDYVISRLKAEGMLK